MVTTDPRAADKEALLKRYEDQVNWYWKRSSQEKLKFGRSRLLILVLGALVTLIASLAAAEFIEGSTFWDRAFKLATPILAAVLSVLTGMSQSFQWGAAWREMVMSAMTLEKERDRISLTPAYRLDPVAEAALFNDIVIGETQRYFERVTGSTRGRQLEAQAVAASQVAAGAVPAGPAPQRSVDLSAAPAPAAYEDEPSDAAPDAYAADYGGGEAADAGEDEEGDGGPLPGGYPAEGEYEGDEEPTA